MPPEVICRCTLCDVEARLLSEFALADTGLVSKMFSAFPALAPHSSVANLLSHLRRLSADETSDDLFRELFALHELHPAFVENCLVLVFIPMLHRTVHLVARRQELMEEEDIAQQTLSFFLRAISSGEMRSRRTHFAFAISRNVKRHIFEWAKRESEKEARLDHPTNEWPPFLTVDDSFERFALLRHFLHRCVTKGLLTNAELDVLIQFKLDGNSGEQLGKRTNISANAVRQKMKRLLGKLRQIAQSVESKTH